MSELRAGLGKLSEQLATLADVSALDERAATLEELATRGDILGGFLHLISTQPTDLDKLAEVAVQVALDGGTIADSGSFFVARSDREGKYLSLSVKVQLTRDGDAAKT